MACNLHRKHLLISAVQTVVLTVPVIRWTSVLQPYFHGGSTKIIFSIPKKLPPAKKLTAGRTIQFLLNYCQIYVFLKEL
jgi:hypothetical protein